MLDLLCAPRHSRPKIPMILTISTTYKPATDLGFLLHKNPDRHQVAELTFGTAHVLYPEATESAAPPPFWSMSTLWGSSAIAAARVGTTSPSPST